MQPYTAEFAAKHLTSQAGTVTIGKNSYQADIGRDAGCVWERGPNGERKYPMVHVMGGKNVYYFLTPLERGRLQVLPLAYDVHKKAWYDMAASGVRHFPDRNDEALPWTDRLFAFNTTCYNCHVTELATNYNLSTDTYHTTWSEPGISCESCHGSAKAHLIAMEQLDGAEPPKDIKIIRTKAFSAAQMNDMCATCHARLVPLSLDFTPGDKFFDHFDLVTWENSDFYPDGRDLGENYTHTSWLTSRCAQAGKLDCNHCHTPSGRPRFTGADSNKSCLPCHETLVNNPTAHGHHAAGSVGNDCIGCHMPMTRFAAMGRTDHSMRPPTPAATIAYQSPNACNVCHKDRDAAWANQWVNQWYAKDYQAETMHRAALIDAARKQDWKRLPEMLDALKSKSSDEVYKTSLVRLLGRCGSPSKQPVLFELLHDASPLVRSSAVTELGSQLTPETVPPLVAALGDESRLVRIRAAMALAKLPAGLLQTDQDRANLKKANAEFLDAMQARPDDWASHANLGNYYMEKRDFSAAVKCFETATQLEPRQIGPWVNAAMAYTNMGQNDKAEACLRRALAVDPASAAANYNLGLLQAEQGHSNEAIQSLRKALDSDPNLASAAYNLSILLGQNNLDEALQWAQKAHDLQPNEPKFACTLAYFLVQKGDASKAVPMLQETIRLAPDHFDSHLLLGAIYQEQNDYPKAISVYQNALGNKSWSPPQRRQLEMRLRSAQAHKQ